MPGLVQSRRKQREQEARADKKLLRELFLDSLDSLKPDYSQSDLEPIEIKKVKFQYTPPDYSRGVELMTEDEIIESVLFPEKHHHRKVSIDEYANAGPEVAEYWRSKIRASELKRGKAYAKLHE